MQNITHDYPPGYYAKIIRDCDRNFVVVVVVENTTTHTHRHDSKLKQDMTAKYTHPPSFTPRHCKTHIDMTENPTQTRQQNSSRRDSKIQPDMTAKPTDMTARSTQTQQRCVLKAPASNLLQIYFPL